MLQKKDRKRKILINRKSLIIYILITLWLALALLRTLYNFSKLVTEERSWYMLTTEQKKEKQFGEKHRFFRFAQKHIPPRSNILLYTSDGMVYYLARYYFYPTTVIWGERQFTEWGNDINRKYDYILYYPLNRKYSDKVVINGERYKKLAEFRNNLIIKGIIYKK